MTASDLSNNPSEVPQEELILPGFVTRGENGVFINLPNLYKYGGFETFVDRLFTGRILFAKLDYDSFIKLLYDADWLAETQAKCGELKIAEKIVHFLPQRQALYRAVKILESGKYAEYAFEPAILEEAYEEPVYGDPDENGVAPITKMVSKTRQQPTKLDFDEFVADMWLKGVKFGIDEKAVRQAIINNSSARVKIAQYLEATAGRDAEILEVRSDMRCDNSPKILASGKADLHSRKNRFPQVVKGAQLLKKVPRVLGVPGRNVSGEVIEPEMPKDLDLSALATVGTCVEQCSDGEYIVSALDGFLTFDQQTRKVSVSEKIENKGGVSTQTTGDLVLDVDEYIEHGEVQEGCVVTGKHMTFLSDVFGRLVSQGGNIVVGGNLSGGAAESFGGNVTLAQRTSLAVVSARDGEITADYCENTTMVGKVIRVRHAVNCELIADEVYAEIVESCMIAAKNIKIASASDRRNNETLVTVLIPDLSVFDQDITNHKKKIFEIQEAIEAKLRQIDSLKSDVEFAKYLALHEKIKSGAIKLTSEQAGNWRKLMEKNSRMVSQLTKFNAEISEFNRLIEESKNELDAVVKHCDGIGNDISCVIDTVTGQTTVQTMKSTLTVEAFSSMSSGAIRDVLQKMDSYKARIFSDDSGAFDWKLKKQKDA